ncbi:hypothetical protein DL93DRAFT_2164038 [Clavulina sp. PMI_390]|nr:hypothetical protein DL93DRAFT_2164038 [Clavulina sp. PMI_390]
MYAVLILALPALVAAVPASTYPHVRKPDTASFAPIYEAANAIPNNYIVVLKDGTTESDLLAHTSFIQTAALRSDALAPSNQTVGVKNVYMQTVKGYSGHFDDLTLSLIRAAPEVDHVEQDQVVWASAIQNGAPWGLARISHRERLRLSTFQKYEYDVDGGDGVDVYVIDTGINIKHVSFQGRASWGATIPENDPDEDGNGHGTHCAGTIASKDYGVAKKAKVIAVKVLRSNGSGSMSDVVAGVDWAAAAASDKAKKIRAEEARTGVRSTFKGSVANMSLGGGKSPALDRVINAAVVSGLHVAVAAGNDNKDACKYSPAGAENAVTVGASTLQDDRAYFSNWGTCVDVFAPGLNILSTWNNGPTSTNTISGTSMASPHVAGLIAYLLSLYPTEKFNPAVDVAPFLTVPAPTTLESVLSSSSNPTFSALLSLAKAILPASFFSPELSAEMLAPIPSPISPKQMKQALILLSSPNVLKDVGEGSPNLLVFNNFTSSYLAENLWTKLE